MAKRSINLEWEEKNYITDLQNVHYLWTLDMNHHQPNIQDRDLIAQPWIQGPVDKLKIILKFKIDN